MGARDYRIEDKSSTLLYYHYTAAVIYDHSLILRVKYTYLDLFFIRRSSVSHDFSLVLWWRGNCKRALSSIYFNNSKPDDTGKADKGAIDD